MTSAGAQRAWSVPVALNDVPESGRHFKLVADERTRAAVAAIAAVNEVPRLEAAFEVTRRGRDGLRVAGRVSATVGQTCVVTLDPIENEVDEAIDVVFAPDVAPAAGQEVGEIELDLADEDAPEPLVGGVVDLGAVATEFLMLGIDPYPRKSGAVLDVPSAGDDQGHPFAALAALKKVQGGNDG